MLSSSSRSILFFARSFHLVSSRPASTVEMLNSDYMSQLGKLSILKSDRVHSPRNSLLSSSHRELARLSPVRHVSGSILGIHSHHSDAASSIQLPHWNQRMDGGSVFYSTSSGAEKPPLPQDDAVNSSFFPKIDSELEALKEEIRKTYAEIEQTKSDITSNKAELQGVNAQLAQKEKLSSEDKAYLLNQQAFLQGEITRLGQREADLRQQASDLRQKETLLLQKEETLRQERARLLEVPTKFTLKQLHQKLVTDMLIRDDRFDQPFLLIPDKGESDIDLMNREPAAELLFSNLIKRVELFHKGSLAVTKTSSPLLAVYGGPGSGKSRFLDEVAQPDRRLKLLLMQENKPFPKVFQTIEDAIGITVTFNSSMSFLNKLECDRDPLNALALRIFYSYFLANTISWGNFAGMALTPQNPTSVLEEVIDSILSDIDQNPQTKSRHIIICVDETLLGAANRVPPDQVQGEFNALMTAIGIELERSTRVHIVLSSLSEQVIVKGASSSYRPLVRLPMLSLTPASVDKLHYEFLIKQTPQDQLIFHRFLLDAGGIPRLLFKSSKILKPTENQSIPVLRTALQKEDPIPKLSQDPLSPQIRNSYLLALGGVPILTRNNSVVDVCIHLGLFIMQNPTGQAILPVIPPSLTCCFDPDNSEMDPIAAKLIKLTRLFSTYNITPTRYQGIDFEAQFNILLRIRCLVKCTPMQTQPSSDANNEIANNDLSSSKQLSLTKLLMMDRPTGTATAPHAMVFGSLFGATYRIPADLKPIEAGVLGTTVKFSFNPGTLWLPPISNYAGIDALLSLKNVKNQNIVFGLQYKWSQLDEEGKSKTDLSCAHIADSIIKTCSHHQDELSRYILAHRFGFIFAAFRDISKPDECQDNYSNYHTILGDKVKALLHSRKEQQLGTNPSDSKRALVDEDHQTIQKLVKAAIQNMLIIDKDHMITLLTPTLAGTLAFSPPSSLDTMTMATSGEEKKAKNPTINV